MSILINSSLITSFLAGTAALFAPCCITVLLPTYLGSIFTQRRKVFFMTFVFLVGIAAVFLPIGLGIGGLGSLFSRLHDWIFIGGALFLIALGVSLFLGFHPRLPFHVDATPARSGVPAIFLLGVFSGLATLCCAPVLAGVLALSVLPGSIFWGTMYSLGYVLGMVIPLFVIALFLDKVDFTERIMLFRKTIRVLKREITLSNLVASLIFLAMGIVILFLSITGRLTMDSSLQVGVNLMITRYAESISSVARDVWVFALPLLFVTLLLTIAAFSMRRSTRHSR